LLREQTKRRRRRRRKERGAGVEIEKVSIKTGGDPDLGTLKEGHALRIEGVTGAGRGEEAGTEDPEEIIGMTDPEETRTEIGDIAPRTGRAEIARAEIVTAATREVLLKHCLT